MYYGVVNSNERKEKVDAFIDHLIVNLKPFHWEYGKFMNALH